MEKINPATLSELENAVQAGERMFRAFNDGARLLAAVRALEGNRNELTNAIAARRRESERVDIELRQAREELESTLGQTAQARSEADAYASKVRADADIIKGKVDWELKAKKTELADIETRLEKARDQVNQIVYAAQPQGVAP
jgi:chromosome segregation ATPase